MDPVTSFFRRKHSRRCDRILEQQMPEGSDLLHVPGEEKHDPMLLERG